MIVMLYKTAKRIISKIMMRDYIWQEGYMSPGNAERIQGISKVLVFDLGIHRCLFYNYSLNCPYLICILLSGID